MWSDRGLLAKRYHESSRRGPSKAEHPKSYQNHCLTPKRITNTPRPFYVGVPPPLPGSKYGLQ